MPSAATDRAIADVFVRVFVAYRVRLIGGAAEPRYVAGTADSSPRLFYTKDFASSALHEAAHWCLAGKRRRAIDDFGYDYLPTAARSGADQLRFETAEVRAQALEWLFSIAAGVDFHVSVDNVERDRTMFVAALLSETATRIATNDGRLPARAERFRCALADCFGGPAAPTLAQLQAASTRV